MTSLWLLGNTAPGPDHRGARVRRTLWMSSGMLYMLPLAGDIHRYPPHKAVLASIALLAFAGSYLGIMLTLRMWLEAVRRVTWVLLGVFTASSVVLPYAIDREWLGTAIFLSIVMAIVLPMRWTLAGVVGATALMVVQCLTLDAGGKTGTLSVTTFSLGVVMAAFRNARVLVWQLQEARSEVARLAANEERLRIARDLHDLLGHNLSLIVLKSELARRLSGRDPAKAAKEVEDIESVARRALAEVREAISGYRRRDLDEEIDGARAVLSAAGVRVVVRRSGAPLPPAVDGLFGWAVREGVTNVVRHARAEECEIAIRQQDGMAVLHVSDDGIGKGDGDGNGNGNGLDGLAERVAEAGGTFAAGPLPDKGFRLTVHAPLDIAELSSQT